MTTSYSENLRVRYVSRGCSKATFFNIIIALIAIVLPYLLCYRSQGFWIKLERFREQPEILWKHEILVILDAKLPNEDNVNANKQQQQSLLWTTLPGLKAMLNTELTPFVTSREADTNFDAVRDFLEFEITFPISSNISIHGIDLILLFEYKLQNYAMMEMESMIFVSKKFGTPGNRYEFVGDMSLVLKEPLWNRYVDQRYNYDVIPRMSSRLEDYLLTNIVKGYAYRNVSTILKNSYDLWLTSPETVEEFSIKGRINYIQETYECWAGLWETLKWAWVQYFAVFIIIYMILKKFQGIVHKAKLFETYLVVPWEKRLGTQPSF